MHTNKLKSTGILVTKNDGLLVDVRTFLSVVCLPLLLRGGSGGGGGERGDALMTAA